MHVVTYHLGEELADPPFVVHRIRDVPAYRRTDPGPTVRKLFQLDPMLAGLLRRLHREHPLRPRPRAPLRGPARRVPRAAGDPDRVRCPHPADQRAAHVSARPAARLHPGGRPVARPSPASTCRPHHCRQRGDSRRAHDPRRLRARAHARHSQRRGVAALPGRAGDHARRAHGHLHRQSRPLSGGGPACSRRSPCCMRAGPTCA